MNKLTNEQERILNTIETSDFANGGRLDPKRQKQFTKYIRDYGRMLPMVRFEQLTQSQSTLDKLYIGEPVSAAVEENENLAILSKPQTGQIHLQTKKLKSGWNITTETLTDNIEQKGFEKTMMEGMTQRISTDIELLAIQGDEEKHAGAVDPFGRLLKRQDGWDKLTDKCHILDVSGESIQKGIFAEMIRMMPQQYLQDPSLKWFVSKSIAIDWADLLSDRMTGVGDAALSGNTVNPYGIPLVEVPLIPDNKPLAVSTGTHAAVIGKAADPFEFITGENDKLIVAIDAGDAVTVTFPQGTFTVSVVCAMINSTEGLAGIASSDKYGRLVLTSPTTGDTSKIAFSDSNALEELGFSEGATTGVATGSAGILEEGSFIWLANPKNFIAAMRGNTRIYSEFNKDYDRLETVVYNEVDFQIENEDSIVKAINLAKRSVI